MALGLVILDVLLRLSMIEGKHDEDWTKAAGERERLLPSDGSKDSPEPQRASRITQDAGPTDDCYADNAPLTTESSDVLQSSSSSRSSSSESPPPMITLLKSHKLLIALGATVVNMTLLTAFDGVGVRTLTQKN